MHKKLLKSYRARIKIIHYGYLYFDSIDFKEAWEIAEKSICKVTGGFYVWEIDAIDELDSQGNTINTFYRQGEERQMDKLINKVKKDVVKGKKKKAMKDIKVLQKADKKFDKKLDKCGIKH